jgi:3-oxoacyl-[acyl-carrier protein] reductase
MAPETSDPRATDPTAPSSLPPVPHLSRSVAGKVVLITGAGGGMGRATAVVFAREGARVAVTDSRADAAARVAAEIAAERGDAVSWALDVADPAAIAAVVGEVGRRFGGLDVVVNNAGIARQVAIDDADYEAQWNAHLAILLSSHHRVVRAALPLLRAASSPRIINIASTEGLGATRGLSAYSAAKAGVIGLTRSLAVELGPEGITVNCICPGPIDTQMTAEISDADKATYARRRTALRRYGAAVEVAHVTLSLALPAASYVTGAIILVDGGLMARNA